MGVGVKVRRLLVVWTRRCCQSISGHPFPVGMAFFMFWLYRSSPLLFSLLISASPVLVCTALLLGTLLSFGQPNIPEIEREEETFSNGIAPLKVSRLEIDNVVARNDDHFLESLTRENKKETKERVVEEGTSVDGGDNMNEEANSLQENVWPVGNTSRDIEFEKSLLRECSTEYSEVEENGISVHNERIGTKAVSGSHEEGEDQDGLIEEEFYHTIEVENVKDKREPSDDDLEIQSESQWKEIDEDDDQDDVSVDSGSDHAESSSPDASMADIRPMLDELHPLLDEEEPLVADMTHEHSDIASEHSDESKSENMESDEDSQNEVAINDDNADDLEEEEAHGGKDGESKSAITWTEDDQKNLMDMGTSELERNKRLENLIARMQARKNTRLMVEKNLIDLDSHDLPFDVPPIATMRRNPFDGTGDAYNYVEFPPIPGSAPSIMLQRRNPFDFPYVPNEDKPDLKGDSFHEEFPIQQQRDAIFRRHESFSTGPSNLGLFRQEKQDVKWRPYFVAEHFTADGRNGHPFQRQASEVCDSKASSVPDTESVASMTSEHVNADGQNYHPFQRQSSEVSDSKASSGPDTESVASVTDQDDRNINEQDSYKEAEAVSNIGLASLSGEHDTVSSEDFGSPDVEEGEKDASLRDENVIMLGNAETQEETESSLSEIMNTSLDSITNETQEEPESSFSEAMNASLDSISSESPSSAGTVYEEGSSKSSSSFYSEVIESVADVKGEENSSPTADLSVKSQFTNEHEGEDVSFSFTRGTVDDNQPQEPVYDSSPPALDRFHSFSSFPAGMQVAMVEMGTSPGVVQNFSDKIEGESMPKNVHDYDDMFASASTLQVINRNGSVNHEITELMEDGMHEAIHSLVNGKLGIQSGQENSTEPMPISSNSPPSWDESIVEAVLHQKGLHDEHGNIILPSCDESVDASHHSVGEHQEGFTSSTSLKETEFSKLERLISNGIEHMPTIDVDLGTKERGVDLTEAVMDELGETHLSPTDGPVERSMELKVDDMLLEKTKMYDPFLLDQVDESDVTSSNQWHVLSEETKLSLHDEHKFYLGQESVLVINPESEIADDRLNVQQEDIHEENPIYSSDVKEYACLTQGVDLEAVNISSRREQLRLEDMQNQETHFFKEESAVKGRDADEDKTPEIPESALTSFSDNTTTSPQSAHSSDGTLDFLSPTWTTYYSDDSVHGTTSAVHARVSEQSKHLKESSESEGNFRVKETIGRSTEGELPLDANHADEIDLPYSPSEPGENGSSFHDIEAKSIEDITQAVRHIHGGANADAKMVFDSSYIDLDHGNSKDQVEENSDFPEPRHVEVTGFHEETADDVVEVPHVREHFCGLTISEVAAVVTDPEMIDSSLSMPILEARCVEDINTSFEQLHEDPNVKEVILPSSIGDETCGGEPQLIELRLLDNIKPDDEDQRPDNMHSEDRVGEDVASDAKNPAEPRDANIAESNSEETRIAIVEKAETSSEPDGCSSMPVLEASSTEITGITSEQS